MNGVFGNLFSRIFGSAPENSPRPEESRLARTGLELESALKQMRERLTTEVSQDSESESERRADGERQKRLDSLYRRARLAVEAMHDKLQCQCPATEIDRLSRFLREHAWKIHDEDPLEEQIDESVLQKIYLEAGIKAWGQLQERMAKAGVSWPAPPYLPPALTPNEIAEAAARSQMNARDRFLRCPPEQMADLMLGVVPSWGTVYPSEDSALWQELCLEAVAASARARFFATALEAWYWRPAELEEELLQMLERELAAVRTWLGQGVTSLATADRLAAETRRVCREAIPQRVWQWLRGRLDHPMCLTDHGVEDPVCGLRFPPERALFTRELEGEVYHFCSRNCLKKFQERNAPEPSVA